MMTGRELLSRRVSRESQREDEVRQDLVHQRLFFYSIETFSRNKSGPIAEFSYLVADEDLNELEGRSGRFLMALPPDVLPDPVCAAAAGISPPRRRGQASGRTSSLRKSSRCFRGVRSAASAGTMSGSPTSASARSFSGPTMSRTFQAGTASSGPGLTFRHLRGQSSPCARAQLRSLRERISSASPRSRRRTALRLRSSPG